MKPLSMFDPNSDRVFRGGSWPFSGQDAHVAYHYRRTPRTRYSYLGFRLHLEVR